MADVIDFPAEVSKDEFNMVSETNGLLHHIANYLNVAVTPEMEKKREQHREMCEEKMKARSGLHTTSR